MSSCPSTACHCGNPCLDVLPRMCQTRPRASVIILLPSVPISQQSPVAIDFETGNCDLQVLVLTCPSLLLCGCRDPVPRPCDPRAPGWESHRLGRSQLSPALWRWLRAAVSQGLDMDPIWTCWSPCQTLLSAQGQHCCGLGITAIIPKNPSRARAQGNRLQQYLFLYKSLQNMGTPLLSPAPSPPKPQPQPEGNRGMDSCQGSGPKHAIFSCFSQINVSAAEKLITKSCPSHRVPRGITTPHYLTSF